MQPQRARSLPSPLGCGWLPFWLLNSRVVTECLQRRHVNVVTSWIILMA